MGRRADLLFGLLLAGAAPCPLGACSRGATPDPEGVPLDFSAAPADLTADLWSPKDLAAPADLLRPPARDVLTLSPPSFVAIGQLAFSLATGDLDRDGKGDVVSANLSSGSLSVLLGSAGGLSSKGPVASASPNGVSIADLDGDGLPDLLATDTNGSALLFHKGKGDGTFLAPRSTASGESPVISALADLDRDGDLDVAVTSQGADAVTVHLGDGKGGLAAGAPQPVGKAPIGVVAADLDGDGVLDLATADYGGDTVSVLLGRGGGAFGPAQALTGAPRPVRLAASDLDGDGRLDLAVSSESTEAAYVFLGKGGGAFAAAAAYRAHQGGQDLVAADLNGDRIPDLALTAGSYVDTLLGRGDGTFLSGPSVEIAGGSLFGLVVVDVDQDGRPDLVAADGSNSRVAVLRNATPRP